MAQRHRVSIIIESDEADPSELLDAMIELSTQFEDHVCANDMTIDDNTACVSEVDSKATA